MKNDLFSKMKRPPIGDWQVEGVQYGLAHHYFILGDDMGLGKTYQALAIAEITKSKTLIVCPAYLKWNWANEIKMFTHRNFSIPKGKGLETIENADYVIINYEMIMKCNNLFEWADFVIFDEAHYLKNLKAKRTDAAHNSVFNNTIKRVALLSGTPIKNRISEWYSLLLMCGHNPSFTSGKNIGEKYQDQWQFDCNFMNKKFLKLGMRRITKFEGMRNIPELKKYLDSKYIRRLKKDHLDIKEAVERTILVDYKDDPDLQAEWDGHNAIKDNTSSAKAMSALKKVKYTSSFVKDLIKEKDSGPVVIFTDHVDSAKAFESQLKGLKVVAMTGQTAIKTRQDYVNMLNAGKLDVLVSTIGSGSSGFNMIGAWNMVFNDLSWVPGDNQQAKARINRVGQNNQPHYYYILGSRQDQAIVKNLRGKMVVLSEAM